MTFFIDLMICIFIYFTVLRGTKAGPNHLCGGISMTPFWLFIFCIPQLSTEPEAFHVRKKRKIYAMFIYDLFHTVLELPFLGLYPMVFCAYVLASMMILKKPLHNARRQMNNMCAAKAINENKSILSSSHAKVISYSSQLLLLLGEALCHFIFAVMWWYISDSCAIGLGSLLSAFYFSVETQMTIGCLDLR